MSIAFAFIPMMILLFYVAVIVGSIYLVIWAINNRIKEKKREKEEHKDYNQY